MERRGAWRQLPADWEPGPVGRAVQRVSSRVWVVAYRRLPAMRRRRARRLLLDLERGRTGKRPLSPSMREWRRQLSMVPKHQRLKIVEDSLAGNIKAPDNRQARRAEVRAKRSG